MAAIKAMPFETGRGKIFGNMAEKLELNPDGSLTIYIQSESPGKAKEVNCLPAPKEGRFLLMRMYQPEERMYRGEHILPPLRPVK